MRRYQQILLATVATGLILLAVLVSTYWVNHEHQRDRMLAFSRHISEIKRLNDASTMSARMAAISRDPVYGEQYEGHAIPLGDRIDQAEALVGETPNLLTRARGLVAESAEIERQAIGLINLGNATEAVVLTQSPAYRSLKERARQVIQIADTHLSARFASAARHANRMLNGLMAATWLLAAVFVALLFYFRRERSQQERHETQVETLRTVMASVMDTQNNFLNNMVYFRTKAEAGLRMDATELRQIDEAIQDVRHRLTEIAETEDFKTRDLGGVRVLRGRRKPRRLAG